MPIEVVWDSLFSKLGGSKYLFQLLVTNVRRSAVDISWRNPYCLSCRNGLGSKYFRKFESVCWGLEEMILALVPSSGLRSFLGTVWLEQPFSYLGQWLVNITCGKDESSWRAHIFKIIWECYQAGKICFWQKISEFCKPVIRLCRSYV